MVISLYHNNSFERVEIRLKLHPKFHYIHLRPAKLHSLQLQPHPLLERRHTLEQNLPARAQHAMPRKFPASRMKRPRHLPRIPRFARRACHIPIRCHLAARDAPHHGAKSREHVFSLHSSGHPCHDSIEIPMINWLVIGIGDITTKRVIPAIQAEPRSRLAGILTRNPEKGSDYPEARIWTSLDDALSAPEINVVYVASPVFLHAPQTIAALRSGKDVLCEKPMALDMELAKTMTAAARETGRTLGIAYYRRTYPKIQRAKALIEQGVIGRPVQAYLSAHDWFNDEAKNRSWILDPTMSGGGPLYDIASHRIDLLNFFFGTPSSATGFLSNVVHERPVEDNATVLIDYPSGVRGIVDVRWHSRIVRDEFRIIGTDGEMSLTPLNGPDLTYPGGSEQIPRHANLHYPCVENFVHAVFDGEPLLATGESSIMTDWVTEQVVRYHR